MFVAGCLCLLASFGLAVGDATYYLGTGRYDITGPSTQIEFMGYASPTQTGRGIHLRLYSRAFVIADDQNKTRVAFISADICMGSQIIKAQVIKKLQSLYGQLYTHDNVLISGIHTHSGPAGFFQYVMYEVMSLGFVKQNLEVIVDGIVESVRLAHESMKKGALSYGVGSLSGANINRSPSAYLNNPAEEKKSYSTNTDTAMDILKLVDAAGTEMGLINWFAVHCTSMNNTNRLVSSDNKGLASLMMERYKNGPDALPGRGAFVAAFAQSNEGDVSPNTMGPHCLDTGKPCDFYTSTCGGKNELCVSPGPGKDMSDSTRIIATKQYEAGKGLYDSSTVPLIGGVKYVYTNVDFSNVTVTMNGSSKHTCPAAMGRSFAAGTTDGPGAFNFEQGDTNSSNPFWNAVRDLLEPPSKEQVACQAPKPILLDTGAMDFPYPWEPKIMPLQLLQLGQFIIIAVPGEFTTMAGRRLRTAVRNVLVTNGYPADTRVVIAGLSNTYSGYITTYEEYQLQRYEGASTAYGPHTLQAYIQEFSKLAFALAKGTKVDPGPAFPNYLDKQLSFHLPVFFDGTPKSFGSVKTDVNVNKTYEVNDTVMVEFWAGNPRNNLMTNRTYLTVELKESSEQWKVLYTDASWETKFMWEQPLSGLPLGHSTATITWDIPVGVASGAYRIQHFGYHKPIMSAPQPYSGVSSEFKVGS